MNAIVRPLCCLQNAFMYMFLMSNCVLFTHWLRDFLCIRVAKLYLNIKHVNISCAKRPACFDVRCWKKTWLHELALTRTIIILIFATGRIQWFCHRGNVLVGWIWYKVGESDSLFIQFYAIIWIFNYSSLVFPRIVYVKSLVYHSLLWLNEGGFRFSKLPSGVGWAKNEIVGGPQRGGGA